MTYIYQRLNLTDIAQRLLADEFAGWSTNGAFALAEYLTSYAESSGEPMEFDLVAIRCEYSEYKSLEDFNEQQGSEYESIEKLGDATAVIEFDGGFIVQDF
jgi:hypothetical protein